VDAGGAGTGPLLRSSARSCRLGSWTRWIRVSASENGSGNAKASVGHGDDVVAVGAGVVGVGDRDNRVGLGCLGDAGVENTLLVLVLETFGGHWDRYTTSEGRSFEQRVTCDFCQVYFEMSMPTESIWGPLSLSSLGLRSISLFPRAFFGEG
jgi:hypothetical protein